MVDSKKDKDSVPEDDVTKNSLSEDKKNGVEGQENHPSSSVNIDLSTGSTDSLGDGLDTDVTEKLAIDDKVDLGDVAEQNSESIQEKRLDRDFSSENLLDASGKSDIQSNLSKDIGDISQSAEDDSEQKNTNDFKQDKEAPINSSDNFSESDQKKKSPLKIFLIPFLVLAVLLLIVVGVSYWTIHYVTEQDKKISVEGSQGVERLEEKINGLASSINATSNNINQLESNIIRQVKAENSGLEKRLRAAEERLQAQNKRLLSLSTTTREDWLLAEAEYLLKLANQRVLIEKSSESAASLLAEADGILRDLGDPDLYPLRQVIQRDLTALRLVEKIDQEGIYLGLLALTNEIDTLPVLPEYKSQQQSSVSDEQLGLEESDKDKELLESDEGSKEEGGILSSWTKKVKWSFTKLVEKIRNSFNIVKYDESPMAMVSPQASIYVRQNLRLILERAQLALLREQQNIYVSSLTQAEQWLLEYFPRSEKRTLFIGQLESVANKNIVRQVPNISESLNLLNTYIQDLHQLKGVSKPVVKTSTTMQKPKDESVASPKPDREAEENLESVEKINSSNNINSDEEN